MIRSKTSALHVCRVFTRLYFVCLCLFLCLDTTDVEAFDQTFALNNTAEPATLDPALMTGVWEQTIALALYEGLTILDPQTLAVRPGVAQRWDVTDGGTRYIFYLRANAKWSNGNVLSANDFVRSWQRVLHPKTSAPNAYHLFHLVNAEKYHRGKIRDFSKVGVRAIDARTLEVILEHPNPNFLFLASFFTLCPVHVATVERYGNQWTKPKHIVSNGPFTMHAWQPNKYIKVRKSFSYWDVANVRLNEVVFYPVDSRQQTLEMYRAGKIQWTGRNLLPDKSIPSLRKRGDYRQPPKLGTFFIRLNTQKAPTNDADVRKALYLAINRHQLVRQTLNAGEQVAYSMTPRGVQDYTPPQAPSFNPAKAAEHLKRAGYCTKDVKKECKPFPKFELLYNTSARNKRILEAVMAMWKENLGISSVVLVEQPWKTYLKKMRAIEYNGSRAAWIADLLDPMSFVELFVSGGSHNSTGWANKEFDEFLQAARIEVNPQKKLEILFRTESLLLKDVPVLPLFHHTSPYLLHSSVEGFYDNILDLHPFKSVFRRALPDINAN